MSNVAKLRFKNFTDFYDKKKLKEIANIFAGGTPSTTKKEFWNGNINWIQSGLVQDCFLKEKDINTKITKLGLDSSSAKLIKPNSTLLAITGATCGKVGYLTFEACANQSVMAFEPYKDSALYLYYLLLKHRNYILRFQAGGAQAGLSKESCENLSFYFPNFNEQKLISIFLKRIDDLILNSINRLNKTKVIKQGILEKIFPVKQTNIPVLRIGKFKGNWQEHKFGSLYEIGNGLNKEKEAFGFGVPIINYMDVNKNVIINDDIIKGRVNLSKEEIENNKVVYGDILFARTSEVIDEVAFSSAYVGNFHEIVFSGFLLKATPIKNNNNDSRFVALYMRYSNKVRSQINKLATKTSRALINGDNLKKIVIELPCAEEQHKIADLFENFDSFILNLQNEIVLLKNIKKTILNKMVQ